MAWKAVLNMVSGLSLACFDMRLDLSTLQVATARLREELRAT